MNTSKFVVIIYDNLDKKYINVRQNFLDLLKFRLNVGREIEEIVETTNISICLDQYYKKGFEWAIIASITNYINDITLCIDTVKEAKEKNSPLIGHILDRGGYYHLHPQWFALDLQVYGNELKSIPLEETKGQLVISTFETERSVENVHDDYTPLWVKPKSNNIIKYKSDHGYFAINLIAKLIEKNYTIVNISDNIRRNKTYPYIEYSYEDVIKFIDDPSYEPKEPFYWFAKILKNLQSLLNTGYYVVNTEDLVNNNYNYKFDRFAGVCGGIKPACIVGDNKFADDTKLFLFDVSDAAIEWQKFLINNWDGSMSTFNNTWNNFKKTFKNFIPLHVQHESIETTMKNFLKKDGLSDEEFKIRWQRYLKMSHNFIKLNILDEDSAEKISNLINDGKCGYVWTSNCFRMDHLVFFKTEKWGENQFNKFKQKLQSFSKIPIILENQQLIRKIN